MTGCVERLAVISFDSDCATRLAIHAPALSNPLSRVFQQAVSVSPKYALSQVVGYIKGKSAIHLARTYGGRRRNFVGQHFWARGYFVSTVGRDEAAVRANIKNEEQEDKRLELLARTFTLQTLTSGDVARGTESAKGATRHRNAELHDACHTLFTYSQ
jgi:Transposase IS200 like